MTKSYAFTLYRFGAMHDGRTVVSTAKSKKDAEDNIENMYPGYTVVYEPKP